MLDDWNASFGAKAFDHRLYFPSDCNATFNMHGHLFDRDRVYTDAGGDEDGELIYVDTGATLTVNGGTAAGEDRLHDRVHVFTDVEQESTNDRFIDVYGGCLTGGNGYDGAGGIFIDSGKEVTLNDVTIAGCMANWSFWYSGDHSGYGGAIIITEGSTKLTMKNCRITGCLAEEDGGAIFCSQGRDDVSIALDNTSIDHNYANSDGGGIDIDGVHGSISAKNGSAISSNKSEGYGGGVYLWNDDATLKADVLGGLSKNSNEAEEGGGVYVEEENETLKNLIVNSNKVSGAVGGI